MKSLWSDRDAESAVARWAEDGVGRDVALRVYTSRLLGGDPSLVLHGGGNTSVKTTMTDITGDEVEVLCIKGSGWDLGDIEPPGLPAVRLAPLRRLLDLEALSDEYMVNVQRGNLLDSTAPNPSVETLLHAFLPHKFVDHTHADAVLAITDQPDGAAICAEVFGDRVALVPYIMPGFALAKKCAEVFAANPGVEGLILLKHGIFSMGETAREAYERMIELTTLAEDRLASAPTRSGTISARETAPASRVAPILRGLVAGDEHKRMILDFRATPELLDFMSGADVDRYAQAGPVTPDHVIRTKPKPLIVPAPAADDLDGFKAAAAQAVDRFRADYDAYFERNNARQATPKIALDAMPRVILVPGLGLFGLGNSAKAAAVAADLAETTARVVTQAEAIGTFESIPEPDIFDIEYWSLEQAKLGKSAEKPLARHVVAVTGGASGIGLATARAFRAQGAEVAVLDRDGDAAREEAAKIGAIGVTCDVTDAGSVAAAFDTVAETFGGLDILVSNAGAAWQGRIGDVEESVLRESFELNFYGHQRCAQAAVRIMRAQDTGGVLLFNTSKQAVNPGADFGPYGLPKAATLFLMRQYALDHGAEGIRSNAVNADRIRSGLLTDDMIDSRSKARGVSRAEYMSGNLLRREVTADDVARAFVDLALAEKTTGAVLTVDGGNIAAALR
jgi:rhamnose utilization protein RhaD (predicted bifunctional aldolase and dehydrogenase)/NAD(P)-dependent dehydrogenase (short-subunit alcohol dehydrogenase family)